MKKNLSKNLRRNKMPVVELKILGKLTHDQKAAIAEQFTATLQEVAGKPPEYTYVIIREVEREDWAHKGKLFSDM
jgi:4-oxalocrotonate tautomerase